MMLAEHHRLMLCYPFTDVPAFTFWEPPSKVVRRVDYAK